MKYSSILFKLLSFILSILLFTPLLQAQDLRMFGSAKMISAGCYELTSGKKSFDRGAIWNEEKLDLTKSFDLSFYLYFGDKKEGADGMVFSLQDKDMNKIGTDGAGNGYEGTKPSLGIEFDTYENLGLQDPVFNHIAVLKNGIISHRGDSTLYGPLVIPGSGSLEDGEYHKVSIAWKAEEQILEVWLDCKKVVHFKYDFINEIFNGETKVTWGMSAATGANTNTHIMCFNFPPKQEYEFVHCAGAYTVLSANPIDNFTYKWFPTTDLTFANTANPGFTGSTNMTYEVTVFDQCNFIVQNNIVRVRIDTVAPILPNRRVEMCEPEVFVVPEIKGHKIVWKDGNRESPRILRKAGKYPYFAQGVHCKFAGDFVVNTGLAPRIVSHFDSLMCFGDSSEVWFTTNTYVGMVRWIPVHSGASKVVHTSEEGAIIVQNQCGSDTAFYRVNMMPSIKPLLPGDILLCGDETTYLKSNPLLEGPFASKASKSWNTGDSSRKLKVEEGGTYILTNSLLWCLSSDTCEVVKVEMPFIRLPDTIGMCNQEVLRIHAKTNVTDLTWSDGSQTTYLDLLANVPFVWVQVSNECGTARDTMVIGLKYCDCRVWTPNAFLYQGKGINQQWNAVSNCDNPPNFKLELYNRWGQKVFETHDISQGWDGSYQSDLAEAGVYVWVISYDTPHHQNMQRFQNQGTLVVLR
ncbi:MAG: gliding motility-associated-like protein [Bacteroidia bacterium]|jgi:gliding motility-associated-like protein